jgi:hypothetical protein
VPPVGAGRFGTSYSRLVAAPVSLVAWTRRRVERYPAICAGSVPRRFRRICKRLSGRHEAGRAGPGPGPGPRNESEARARGNTHTALRSLSCIPLIRRAHATLTQTLPQGCTSESAAVCRFSLERRRGGSDLGPSESPAGVRVSANFPLSSPLESYPLLPPPPSAASLQANAGSWDRPVDSLSKLSSRRRGRCLFCAARCRACLLSRQSEAR